MQTMTLSKIQNGEIRHVTKNPRVIIKVMGPLESETLDENNNAIKLDMFIQTNEFPKYHYVVILSLIDSYTEPGHKFYIAKLITHSSGYDNLKITEDLFDKSTIKIDLAKSYVTRDKFLIPEAEVQAHKAYGHFDLVKLKDASEY